MVRATAANAQIRAFACTTRETVETKSVSQYQPCGNGGTGKITQRGRHDGKHVKG